MAQGDRPEALRNIIVVSDTHCGCQMGLCPSEGIDLDGGGRYNPSPFQVGTWKTWKDEFWGEWVPKVTRGEPYAVVVNGDGIEGVHHRAVTQISHNIEDQLRIAEACFSPVLKGASALYWIRGTEAHVGPSAQHEERLAKSLGAVPNEEGRHARWDLLARLGERLVHIAHHIGVSSSPFTETSANLREIVKAFVESGRWGDEVPDVFIRSHAHRCSEVRLPSQHGWTSLLVTAGWQGLTPYTYRRGSSSLNSPQFGGALIRCGDEEIYTRARVWRMERSKEVVL